MNRGWYVKENSVDEQPPALDTTTSGIYVYVRKDFVHHEESDTETAHYSWMEYRIPRDVYGIFLKVTENETVCNELLNAICELAALIGE